MKIWRKNVRYLNLTKLYNKLKVNRHNLKYVYLHIHNINILVNFQQNKKYSLRINMLLNKLNIKNPHINSKTITFLMILNLPNRFN